MSEIVNFNRAKKRRAQARDDVLARENRVRFGRTAGEKLRDRRAEAAREALLDGARREDVPAASPQDN